MKYYVYCHYRKGETKDTPFYVGKGSDKRLFIKSNRSEYWKRIVNKYGYNAEILYDNLSEDESFDLEIKTILKYKELGYCEANFSDGGDGVKVLKRWWGKKISESLKGMIRAKGEENKSYKNVISKETLIELYINQKKSSIEIAKDINITYATVCSRLKEYNIPLRKCGKDKIQIKCLNDGKVFSSLSETAKYYNLHKENIRKVVRGIYKHTGKKQFIQINN
jgi:hypothetical protein